MITDYYIDSLLQSCSYFSALALELLQSWTKPSIFALNVMVLCLLFLSKTTDENEFFIYQLYSPRIWYEITPMNAYIIPLLGSSNSKNLAHLWSENRRHYFPQHAQLIKRINHIKHGYASSNCLMHYGTHKLYLFHACQSVIYYFLSHKSNR